MSTRYLYAAVGAAIALAGLTDSARAQLEAPEESLASGDLSGVLVIGDSLAIGTEPFLGRMLPDHVLTWDNANGRTTPGGMLALRLALRDVRPEAVVVSLGTNDGPDPRRFASRLQRTLRTLPPETCVIWSTIVRPPRKGGYLALNAVLREEVRRDGRLTLVEWDRAVQSGTVVLPDGLHADKAGYAYRSWKIAQAIRAGCPASSG